MTEAPYFTTLPNRGLVKVSGPDRRGFLQGLISNDINLLDTQPCVYACLLTAQGKFLHDFFITEHGDSICIECEGGARAEDLARRLSMHKLRAKVEIKCIKEITVFAIWPPLPVGACSPSFPSPPFRGRGIKGEGAKYSDPRHPQIGFRSFEKPILEEKPFETWDRHRIMLTVADGSRDMIPEKSTLLESNIDKLNGISFEKGCYMGQELTARMNYRGLVKKRLYTIHLNTPPLAPPAASLSPPLAGGIKGGSEIRVNGELIGEMRSSCGDVGIALLKDNEIGRDDLPFQVIKQPDRG